MESEEVYVLEDSAYMPEYNEWNTIKQIATNYSIFKIGLRIDALTKPCILCSIGELIYPIVEELREYKKPKSEEESISLHNKVNELRKYIAKRSEKLYTNAYYAIKKWKGDSKSVSIELLPEEVYLLACISMIDCGLEKEKIIEASKVDIYRWLKFNILKDTPLSNLFYGLLYTLF